MPQAASEPQTPSSSPLIVTIDGPAGTGKSTVARRLASWLKIEFLDTGAMYRAVAWKCLQAQITPEQTQAAADLARGLRFQLQNQQLLVDGALLGEAIRTPEVSAQSSRFAAAPEIREILVEQQRRIGQQQSLVTEGRDQGTVVFPGALCKFFLTARPEVRALRRYQDLQTQQEPPSFEEVLQAQQERDERDTSRAASPLRAADDALLIDTSDMSLEEVITHLAKLVEQRQLTA